MLLISTMQLSLNSQKPTNPHPKEETKAHMSFKLTLGDV